MNRIPNLLMELVLGSSLVFSAGCATANPEKESLEPPLVWTTQFDHTDSNCAGISGEFANRGEKFAGRNEKTQEALLAEAVFLQVLPRGVATKSVLIESAKGSGAMRVTLQGDSVRTEEHQVSCESGWLVTRHARRGQYLGEGVVEKHYDQVTFLREGKSGELIARVKIDAEFNSMYLFNSKARTDDWYRFQPAE